MELEKQLPPLYGQEEKGEEATGYVKLFSPDSNWTWYITEYDPAEKIAFGLVDGFCIEYGYFSVQELEEVEGPMGLPVERDLYFKPKKIGDIKKMLERQRTKIM